MLNRYAIIILFFCSPKISASEPLRGPELGWYTWRPDSSPGADGAVAGSEKSGRLGKEHRLSVDAPIPVALWLAMPFFTMRYEDQLTTNVFKTDQRFGVGFLHHAAEGEPAWRLDMVRLGNWANKPGLHARCQFNLIKSVPTLRLRASDTAYSWLGLSALKLPNSAKTIFIPELSWSRLGTDGLAIDILAPQHIYLGYRGKSFGFMTGVQQIYRLWQPSDGRSDDDGAFQTQSKVSLLYTFETESSGSYVLTSTFLNEIASNMITTSENTPNKYGKRRGVEISIQWIPNA